MNPSVTESRPTSPQLGSIPVADRAEDIRRGFLERCADAQRPCDGIAQCQAAGRLLRKHVWIFAARIHGVFNDRIRNIPPPRYNRRF